MTKTEHRQQKWGRKNVRHGLCRMCGKRRIFKAGFCEFHYAEHAERCRYRYYRTHPGVDPYKRTPKERTPRQRACAHQFARVPLLRRIWKRLPPDGEEIICTKCGFRKITRRKRFA